MAAPMISVSGLRGIVGEGLDSLVALRYTAAFLQELPAGPVVVTRDGRSSGTLLADAVRSAICAAGRKVLDAGICATPTAGVLVRQCQAAGGVQITASHNPPEYNGLKLLSAAGRAINAQAGQRVLERYGAARMRWVPSSAGGAVEGLDDPLSEHARLVLGIVDVERIRRRRYRVLLDSNRGAGGPLGYRLLHELGCEITHLGAPPDGNFEHPAEPTATNLAGVLSHVSSAGLDIGFCQDPDGDRLAVIDEQGRYLGEEYTLALCLAHILPLRRGPVVTNCSSSRMAQDLAHRHGVPLLQSAVGEANVTDLMLAKDAVFGGEGNGGPIDPRVGYVRDSFVGMALILDALAARGLPVSQLADELPRYEMVKTKVRLAPGNVSDALATLQRRFADARPSRLDGLRLDWPDKWLLVRPSNTEPIVRAFAEAPTRAEAEELCAAATRALAAAAPALAAA